MLDTTRVCQAFRAIVVNSGKRVNVSHSLKKGQGVTIRHKAKFSLSSYIVDVHYIHSINHMVF